MSEEVMVRHCSPTLAGLKTGSMFSYPFANSNDLRNSVRHWNRLFFGKGLRVLPLCQRNGRALIYVFRPQKLCQDLQDSIASELLNRCGYCDKDPQKCIRHLMKRLNEGDSFPHEVGLFLGYPPVDVQGFIENRAKNPKCVGHWKVYGDERAARKRFELYDKCTRIYCQQWAKEKNIERLTIAG